MASYEKVLNAIDEELIAALQDNPDWKLATYEGRKKAFLSCLKDYMEEHPEKREKVKAILANTDGYCLSNTRAGHVELYFLPLFHDTETLLQILENPYSYQRKNILMYEPEQKVLDVIFEQEPQLMISYLKEHLDKKEEYKALVLEMLKQTDCSGKVFEIYNDKKSCLEFINDEMFVVDLYGKEIMKYNQESDVVEALIEKSPSLVIDFLQMYPEKKEEYKSQALDFFKMYCNGETNADSSYFRYFFDIYEDDKQLLLDILDKETGNAIYSNMLSVCQDRDIINKMLDKLADMPESQRTANMYCSIVKKVREEEVYKRILAQTNNSDVVELMTSFGSNFSDEFKEKLLHHPNLSGKGFYNLSECMPESAFDDGAIERMLEKFSSETYDTYSETKINSLFQYVLRIRPNAEFANKVLDSCLRIPNYGKNRFSSMEQAVLKSVLKVDTSDRAFNRVLDYAMVEGFSSLIEDVLKKRPTKDTLQKVEVYYQAYYKEKAKAKAEMQEVPLDKGEKEQFDYIGYYKTMGEFWRIAVAKSEDVEFLDKILAKHSQNYRKAWRQSFKIKSSYDRESAQSSIEYEKREFEEALKVTGYIKKKLAADYPKLSFEKALSKAFKCMITTADKKEKTRLHTILMAEGFDFYVNYLENAEGKISPEILDYVLKEKEKMFDKLQQYEEDKRQEIYAKIKGIEETLHDKGIIKAILSEKCPDLSFEEAIIREAARVVKSGDAHEKERFNNLLLAEGERELLNGIDERVCEYLVDNFTQKNLDDVNALRSFYGLKIIIDETPFETPNLRTVRRMQFDDSVSTTDPESEYYVVQYSEAYRNFKADKRRKFKESDYYDMMDRSEAFQTLFDYGYADFAYTLPQSLAKAKVPPEVAEQFNIKDLQAVFYYTLPDEEKDVYSWDGDFLFTKQWIEIEGEYDEADLMGARQSYWMDMVCNKQLVQTMKNDFLRHGVSGSDAEKLFEMAEGEGRPNAGRRLERVTSVKLPLHHILGLKDGGLNYPSNYAPVVIYEDGLNSHTPLHRYDTPKDKFYVVKGAKKPTDIMLTRKPSEKTDKVVRIRTIFTDDEINPHKKVLFYGGARKSSRYVGRLHGMENIALEAEKLGKEYRERDAKSQLLMQIVFQNYVDMHNRLEEVETLKKNKEKKKKIEENKAQMRRKTKRSVTKKNERNV